MVDFVVKKSFFVGAQTKDISEDYNIGRKLGDGAYGVVFLGTHIVTGAERAIKRIPKSRITNPVRLETEIRVMRESDHPNIVRLYDVYEDNLYMNLVMEKCSGGELFDFVLAKKRLSEKEAAGLFAQMVSSVKYLHMHDIIHRDLKPENLLFQSDPNQPQSLLKLCDFGLAKMMTKEDRTMVTRAGTPFYIAPEILSGQPYGSPCDVWSLGVILFILISGYPPFFGRSDNLIYQKVRSGNYNFNRPEWANVTESVKELISRLLVVDPQARMSIEDILKHPWVSNNETLSEDPLSIDLSGLADYRNSLKLKKAMLMCIASHCSDDEIKSLREVFMKLDTDNDGAVTMEELKAGIAHLSGVNIEAETLMRAIDVDGNNRIDYTEFVAATLDQSVSMREAKILEAFRLFDRDGSGRISSQELRNILGREDQRGVEFWEKIISEIDVNSDGEIDFNEFLSMMTERRREALN